MIRSATLLAAAALLGAADLELAEADASVRAPLLWRGTAVLRGASGARPPLRLEARLESGSTTLAASEVVLADAATLAAGVRLVLAPAPPPAGAGARLVLRLTAADRQTVAELARDLLTPGAVAAALERWSGASRAASPSALQRLHAEQAAELLDVPLPTQAALATAHALVASLSRPDDPAQGATVLADAVDASVHPLRIHRPPGAVRAVALLLRPGAGLRKSAWPPPPAAWLAAAAAAGTAVVEPYPAGDRDGSGVLARRALIALGLARAAGLPGDPVLVVAEPACAPGARRLAGDPAVAGLRLTDTAPGPGDPAAWSLPAPAGTPLPAPAGHLAAWAQGPFVVVVGSGEHLAAAQANRALAEAFVQAWAAHAHGIPPVCDDRSFEPAAWPRHHLVLVGAPASNRVTSALAPSLPVTWDQRSLHWPGGDGPAEALRSERRAVAACVPHPGGGGRVLLVLDGAPAWSGPGLPLAEAAGDWLVRGGGQQAGGTVNGW